MIATDLDLRRRARRDVLVLVIGVVAAALIELTLMPVRSLTARLLSYDTLFMAELLVILAVLAIGGGFYSLRRLQDAERLLAESVALQTSVDQAHGLNRRYRSYAEAVVHGQEEERMRLARDLHDDSIHRLILVGQRLELTRLDHHPSPAEDDLAEVQGLVNDTIDGMRRFIQELRPTFLDELGLLPALEALVDEKAQRTGLDIPLRSRGSLDRLSATEEVTLFRIAQAALRNVVLHAGATTAEVCLEFGTDAIVLEIIDDGIGFDPDGGDDPDHFGLLGMRERAELQGGTFSVDSAPGAGTTVSVTLPRSSGT